MTWTKRTKPTTQHESDRAGLWSNLYFPWKASSRPWAKTVPSTTWDKRNDEELQEIITQSGETIITQAGETLAADLLKETIWTERT